MSNYFKSGLGSELKELHGNEHFQKLFLKVVQDPGSTRRSCFSGQTSVDLLRDIPLKQDPKHTVNVMQRLIISSVFHLKATNWAVSASLC